MKRLLLGATSLLAITAWASAARAIPFDFTYTGSLVTFTVPTTDTYQIIAFGAQGGNGTGFNPNAVGAGGLGAEIGGNFSLTAGEVLQIAVGGAGSNRAGVGGGGGGGGTFVVGPDSSPLVIAGGGGGGGGPNLGGFPTPPGFSGGGGLTGPDGGGPGGGTGGNGGDGAVGSFGGGGGGGGFFSAGGTGEFRSGDPAAGGGGAFPDLAGGQLGGGFGGGGGASAGAGGGGGYSGGGGGESSEGGFGNGEGGGSIDAGIDQILVADFQTGNGEVVITEVAIPEPASIALLGSALAGLAVVWRRRRMETD